MAGLRVAVPPLRFRVRGLAPTVTLTRGWPFVAVDPLRLGLRCRDCDRRRDELCCPAAACPLGAAATRAAVPSQTIISVAVLVKQGE